MIPKTIHYCWFGNTKKSKTIKKCIESWKRHLTDFEIIEWNESNCDLSHPFMKRCVELKKWAFLSDYLRLKKLHDLGGVYLDTDMLIYKDLKPLLYDDCFFGAESVDFINGSIIGSKAGHHFLKLAINEYDIIDLNQGDFDLNQIVIPRLLTRVFNTLNNSSVSKFDKILRLKGMIIYPSDFFYPLPYRDRYNFKEIKNYLSINTYAVHLWNASWVDYSEFKYLKQGEYKKAIIKILFSKTEKFSFNYLKRLLFSFKQSINKK